MELAAAANPSRSRQCIRAGGASLGAVPEQAHVAPGLPSGVTILSADEHLDVGHPQFSLNVASKGLRVPVSILESTLAALCVFVDSKGFTLDRGHVGCGATRLWNRPGTYGAREISKTRKRQQYAGALDAGQSVTHCVLYARSKRKSRKRATKPIKPLCPVPGIV
jgi:hypothetical protein